MATSMPVLNQFGGGMGTSSASPIPAFGAGSPMPGVGSSAYTPQAVSGGNPTGTSGASTTAGGAPVLPGSTPAPGAGAASSLTTAPGATGLSNGLSSIYGEATGDYLSNILQNDGMNLPLLEQTNASEINAMQPEINQGSANLAGTLGAQGVSGNSSTNALAQSNYQSQATATENATISQNYMSEYDQGQKLLSSILGPLMGQSAQSQADQLNWEDLASLGLGVANSGASVIKAVAPFGF